MADPRFYDNRGPFAVSHLCRIGQLELPDTGASELIYDVAALDCAGPPHLAFCDKRQHGSRIETAAGFCIGRHNLVPSAGTTLLLSKNVGRSFAAVAATFYPQHESGFAAQTIPIHPSAKIGTRVSLSPGVIIGPNAEIGDGANLGPHCVIGRGVSIGGSCEIGGNSVIGFAYVGDEVVIKPGAVIGASGFGFASGADGHLKIPQLGRVIIQDRAEIGANSTIDRAALTDTVIGEGTKIDNLVQIGHNARIGRHCVLAGQSGVAGSVVLGDFVVVGGKSGVAEHLNVGSRARLAGFSGVVQDLDGARDYGGIPARPIRDWHRQNAWLAKAARRLITSHDE